MKLRPLKTETDYQQALAEIEKIFDASPNTPEGDLLEILTTLVEVYEEKNYPIEPPDPISAIIYHLESRGLSSQDLTNLLGSQETVNNILERKQALTLEIIRKLNHHLGISADVLIQPYILSSKLG